RRWVARNTETSDKALWKEAWGAVHADGAVNLASAAGAGRGRKGILPAGHVESRRVEAFAADLMGMLRASSNYHNLGDYEVRIGLEWTGQDPLTIQTSDESGFPYDGVPLARFVPVTTSVRTDV